MRNLLFTLEEGGVYRGKIYSIDELMSLVDMFNKKSGQRVDERIFIDFGSDIFLES